MLTIQYLEDSPGLAHLDHKSVVIKLRSAVERLPVTHLLIGWHLPRPLLETCRLEAEHLGLRFIRWQPLLTGDKVFFPKPAWHTVTFSGQRVVGYRGLSEFTFACPNHPAVQEAVTEHLTKLVRSGLYQGFFLDRVRFPSPSIDPLNHLTCFCEFCRHKAAQYDLDLEEIRQEILRTCLEEKGRINLVKTLLSREHESEHAEQLHRLVQFLAFRRQSILEFLAPISQMLRQSHLEIGLDCFSPCLTTLVGQDLRAMSEWVDWIKIMTYAHTFAPAGLPFELSGLLKYLTSSTNLSEIHLLDLISRFTGLPLPTSFESLEKDGFSTSALEKEVRRGVGKCTVPVLAGLELVKLDGVTNQTPASIQADLIGLKSTNPAGLAISWDLLHIPLEWLDLVRQVYFGNE